jgi:hypothetical protein
MSPPHNTRAEPSVTILAGANKGAGLGQQHEWQPALAGPVGMPAWWDIDHSIGRAAVAPEPRPPRKRRRARWVVGLALVAILAGGGSGAALAMTGSSSHLASAPAAWDPKVIDVVHFVEQDRGHTFLHPVRIRYLDEAAFNAKVSGPASIPASVKRRVQDAVSAYRAIGLIHGNLDLLAASKRQVQESVAGIYVPSDRTVYVRGNAPSPTPYLRVTLAHELTHALQDQLFDLKKLRSPKEADPAAITALIEGDAMRVEYDYIGRLTGPEQTSFEGEASRFASTHQPNDVPTFMQEDFASPYVFGQPFVQTLYAFGGIAALDAAFKAPPVSDAQILNPARYALKTPKSNVAPPVIPGNAISPVRTFGLTNMMQILGSGVDYGTAWSALKGWQGSTIQVYKSNGRVCVAVATEFDTTGSAGAFTAATHELSRTLPQASATQTGTRVAFKACDPGPTAPPIEPKNPDAWRVLATRSTLLGSVSGRGASNAAQAQCIADAIIDAVGPTQAVAAVFNPASFDQAAQQAFARKVQATEPHCWSAFPVAP